MGYQPKHEISIFFRPNLNHWDFQSDFGLGGDVQIRCRFMNLPNPSQLVDEWSTPLDMGIN